MANPNFVDTILDGDPSEAEAPKGLPPGQYIFLIDGGRTRIDVTTKKGTRFVEFACKPIQPVNVDQDALNEVLTRKDGSKRSLDDMWMRNTYYLTEDSVYRLSQFMKHCGLDIEGEKKSYSEWISEMGGCQFLGTVIHSPREDNEGFYSNMGRTAPVPTE